jgi:hypothetical protein
MNTQHAVKPLTIANNFLGRMRVDQSSKTKDTNSCPL